MALILGAMYIPQAMMNADAATIRESDVNKDGIINTKDIIRILKYIKDPATYPYDSKIDVNGDGSISRTDITAMKSFMGETYDVNVYVRPTYEALVDKIIQEAKWVTDFCNYNNFTYGDSFINPAVNFRDGTVAGAINPEETVSSCNRFVSWVLYRAGYTDQVYFHGGLPSETLQSKYGFTKITDINQVKRGDIVYIPGHEFLCAGTNLRYDHGSTERIRRIGGYAYVENTNEPFSEAINSSFMYAMRPNPAGLPDISIEEIYDSVPSKVAEPSASATTVATYANGTGNRTFNYHYYPYSTQQYELHLTLSSTSTSSVEAKNGAFVGVRLPSASHAPTGSGGIWFSFSNSAFAALFTGVGCGPNYNGTQWWEYLTQIQLPKTFATAQKLVVVDSGDVIKYYVYPGDGTKFLICSIRVDTVYDQICIRNVDGKMIYAGLTALNDSGYFGLWTHYASVTSTNISIKKV